MSSEIAKVMGSSQKQITSNWEKTGGGGGGMNAGAHGCPMAGGLEIGDL